MRVVHYLWSAQIGGIERLVLDLTTTQRERATDAAVLFGTPRGSLLRRYLDAGLPVETASLRGGGDLSPARGRWLERHFRRFDVVHLHAYHPLVARAAVRSGRRVLFTEHGAFGFDRRRQLRERLKRLLKARFLNRLVDFVTFNSEYTRRQARALYGLEAVPQEVVYNGSRIPAGAPADTADEAVRARCRGRFVVGTVARFTPVKRLDRLVDGFAALPQRETALLLLVGDGPERPRLADRAAQLGLGDEVLFLGYRDDVRAYQALMDVCVLPSEREAFGLAALEALALGKPAVVFADGGGMVEFVGALEPRDVVGSVAELACRLQEHRAQIAAGRLDDETRRSHARRFDIGVMAGRFDGIYEGLVRSRRDGRR